MHSIFLVPGCGQGDVLNRAFDLGFGLKIVLGSARLTSEGRSQDQRQEAEGGQQGKQKCVLPDGGDAWHRLLLTICGASRTPSMKFCSLAADPLRMKPTLSYSSGLVCPVFR